MTKIIAIDARLAGGRSTGDSTYWTGLLEGLSGLQTEYRFLLYSNAPRPPGIPESPMFQWLVVPARQDRWWSWVVAPLAARRAGADLWHTQYALSPLARGGVTTVHDVSFLIGPEWFRPKDRFLLKVSIPSSARRAKAVITVSETSRGEIERLVPIAKGKTFVTPLACPNWIRPVERAEARAAVREKWGLDSPFALTVSTRWPRKNMELAVRACDLLDADVPLRLALTGKAGWGDQSLGNRAISLGYVDQDALSALYSAAVLYLAPSRHEGFGLPLLEAFACGCPVLCSTGGALPETAGDAAYIEQSWEPAAWAKTIAELWRDSSKLEALRYKGLSRAKAFSWTQTAQATLDVYRRVLK